MIVKITDKDTKRNIARKVLEALDQWFEVEESREKFIAESAGQTFIAAEENGEYVGFLCLKQTGNATVELAVMGVLKEYHRRGIGKALFEEAVKTAKAEGHSFMQVKTVRMGMYDDYDRKNLFYISCGFKVLEVINEIWGDENPCQIYIMSL